MSINSTLKKEGITVIRELDTMQINSIASNISEKLVATFPEHNLNKSDLFISICRLNMYIADMPNDMAMAKYFYKNNSIYFSKDMNLQDLSTLAFHECLHYIQTYTNNRGKLLRLGLYNLETTPCTGMALNEAAVQLMAATTMGLELDSVKYYNMELTTESPDYYPIQTALLNEMIYFTGSYPLFYSTLYCNDVFKNTFIAKSNIRAYTKIEKNFDLIFEYETKLSKEIYKQSLCSEDIKDFKKLKRINSRIDDIKKIILEKTIETQNIILDSCFNSELNSIKTLDDIKAFQYKLYNFKHLIISTKDYNYYNEFYVTMMAKAEEKKEFILKFGNISSLDCITNELDFLEEKKFGFQFFKQLFDKLKLLVEEGIRNKEIN